MTAMTDRALIFRRFGDPAEVLALEAQPAPAPAAGEAVVAITHRSINPSDLIPITGAYAHRVAPPRIAGYEGVGIVERAADGSGLSPGDRVLALRGSGTWASRVTAPASFCVAVPADIPDEAAAQAYINPLTAWALLVHELALPAGAVIAIDAAGSAFGACVLAFARRHGWQVVAVTTAAARTGALQAAGAAAVVVTEAGEPAVELAVRLRRAAGGRIDAGLDAVGGEIGTGVALAVSPGGAFRFYGLLSGRSLGAGLAGEVASGVTVRPFWLRHWQDQAGADAWRDGFAEIFDAIRSGDLCLPAEAAFALDDWRAALAAAGRRDRRGKILLTGG